MIINQLKKLIEKQKEDFQKQEIQISELKQEIVFLKTDCKSSVPVSGCTSFSLFKQQNSRENVSWSILSEQTEDSIAEINPFNQLPMKHKMNESRNIKRSQSHESKMVDKSMETNVEDDDDEIQMIFHKRIGGIQTLDNEEEVFQVNQIVSDKNQLLKVEKFQKRKVTDSHFKKIKKETDSHFKNIEKENSSNVRMIEKGNDLNFKNIGKENNSNCKMIEKETDFNFIKVEKETNSNCRLIEKETDSNCRKINEEATKIVDEEEISKETSDDYLVKHIQDFDKQVKNPNFTNNDSGEQRKKTNRPKSVKTEISETGLLNKNEPGLVIVPQNEKPFECKICFKRFTSPAHVDAHIKVAHEKVTPYRCKICSAYLGSSRNVDRHVQAVHQKVKLFKCQACPASFGSTDCLRRHGETVHHEKVTAFKCQACKASFRTSGNLNRHHRSVHEKLRPFRCKICFKSFVEGRNLRYHNENVHFSKA